MRDTSSRAPASARRAVRTRPVTVRYGRGEIDVAGDASAKLIRRLRHLDGAREIIAKLDAAEASQPIDLTEREKGFLVIAIKAWMQDVGRDRVPNPIVRLRETLMGDVFFPPDDPEPQPDPVTPEPAPDFGEPAPVAAAAEVEARASLLRLREGIATAIAALERASAEVEAALARSQDAQITRSES